MTDLFLDIFNASVAASWVVLAIIAARLLLKKAPRWMVCALWALVAVRLLWPGFLEAPFSLIPSREIIPPQSLFAAAPVIDSGVEILDNAINPVYTESLRPMPGASVNPLQVWLAVYANIWVLGMAAMILRALLSCRRVRRQIRERIRLEGNIYLCDRIESPFLFGLLRPIICLPSNLDGQTRDYVIAHEKAHLARRDHWWKPLGFLLLTVNWFNPLMWIAYLLLCRDIEMACDERVARKMDVNEKKAYSTALLQCSIRSRHVTVCPLAFGEVGVKQRVKSVLHYKKPAFWVILLTAVVIAILAAGLLTDPMTRVSELRYNGSLYILEHQDVSFLPVQENTIGDLRSILHNTTEHPMEEFQATNLDESLTGCPLFLEENRIYLQKYDGTCIAFRLVESEPDSTIEHTFEQLDVILYCAFPNTWDMEELEPNGSFMGVRCRPSGREDWLYIRYYWSDDTLYGCSPDSQADSITLSNGIRGKLYHTGDPNRWNRIILETSKGHLYVEFEKNTTDWTNAQYTIARFLLGNLSVVRDGKKVLIASDLLGITLRVQNADSKRLDLVCTQRGREEEFAEIITGSEWTVERLEETGWVSCMPRELAWDDIAYLVHMDSTTTWSIDLERVTGPLEPGHYRIGKTFIGHPYPDEIKSTTEAFTQTYYAEFDLNSLGISLSVFDVTPSGLTLLCEQDGTLWDQIITGAPWHLEQWTENGWVSRMPEFTAWTSIGYLVNQNDTTTWNINWSQIIGALAPGHYRLSKHFTGIRRPPVTLGLPRAETEQTIYVEFILE